MITKKQIDALVASKLDLYKSNEHFKHISKEKLENYFREEVASLCELESPEICLKRCHFFELDGTIESDFRERVIYLDDKLFFLAGIRFTGFDKTKPFISIFPSFNNFNDEVIYKISAALKKEFYVFRPLGFHVTLPDGVNFSSNLFEIDRYTVVGSIKEILKIPLEKKDENIELIQLSEVNFYDEYVREYKLLYKNFPYLRAEVQTESIESLNESAQNGLLFKIEINKKMAGIIAGYIENYFGQNEVCILEEILFENYRGRGFAAYVQKAFAQKMENRFNLLWGHISHLNRPSLKTAIKNGRAISEVEYIFNFN